MKIIKLSITFLFSLYFFSNASAAERALAGQYVTKIATSSGNSVDFKAHQFLFQLGLFESSPVRLYLGLGLGYGVLAVRGDFEKKDSEKSQETEDSKNEVEVVENNRISIIMEVGPEFVINPFFRLQLYIGADLSILGQHQKPDSTVILWNQPGRAIVMRSDVLSRAAMPFTKMGLRGLILIASQLDFMFGVERILIQALPEIYKAEGSALQIKMKPSSLYTSEFHAINISLGLRYRFAK